MTPHPANGEGVAAPRRSVRHSFRLGRLRLVPVLLLFVALTVGLVRTRLPLCDEGFYGDPAFNLVAHGNMGSPVLIASERLKGIERYTYWEMPLHILATAAAFRAFGTSLMAMRSVTVFWGVLGLSCWYIFLRDLFPGKTTALLATGLLSVDFVFATAASTARSDMMSLALGSAGLAAYMRLRKEHLRLALVSGHALVMLSGLAHPNGGLASFTSLLAVMWWFDRGRFSWTDLAVAAAPYAVGAACWAGYVLQRPDYFLAQFGSSAGSRLSGLVRPWPAIRDELIRYANTFGLRSTGLLRVRAVPLALYAAGVTAALLVRRLRHDSSCRLLLLMTGIQFVLLTFLEGAKQPWYLLFIIPLPISLTAAAGSILAAQKSTAKIGMLTAGVLLVGVQVGQTVALIERDPLDRFYAPAVRLIRENLGPTGVVAASTEFGFGVGFDRVLDDPKLGSTRHVDPVIVVIDANYRGSFDNLRLQDPDLLRGIEERLTAQYAVLSRSEVYTVYARLGSGLRD